MFQEVIVVDYITDINALTNDQIDSITSNLVNPNFLENCPCGTVIAIPISGNLTNQKRVYYPFFSHVNFPLKPGERAWSFDQNSGRVSYWVTRKVQNTSANDLNFSHDDRARLYGSLRKEKNGRETNSSIFFDSLSSGILLESIANGSVAKSEFVGEPVLGLKSKSIDLTIQGSNNTAIRMTSENGTGTGTIDIVAGPAMVADQTKILNARGYEEIVKPILTTDSGYSSSGNLGANDESRIVISRNFNADSYYSITGNDSGTQPTISLKSDAIRIVAINDLKISVNNGTTQSSIIIKNDGNVIITPGAQIKLSGDFDDQAYLRYDQFNQIIQELLDICGSLQSSLGPSATAAITAAAATTSAGNPPGTPTGDAFVDAAVTAANIDRFAAIGVSSANIYSLLETIKSTKILGS